MEVNLLRARNHFLDIKVKPSLIKRWRITLVYLVPISRKLSHNRSKYSQDPLSKETKNKILGLTLMRFLKLILQNQILESRLIISLVIQT